MPTPCLLFARAFIIGWLTLVCGARRDRVRRQSICEGRTQGPGAPSPPTPRRRPMRWSVPPRVRWGAPIGGTW